MEWKTQFKLDPRYPADAYEFIYNAVIAAIGKLETPRHLSAVEILKFVRRYAVEEYGVLAKYVLMDWGMVSARDVGFIVYELIRNRLLAADENDKIEDFNINFDLFAECDRIFAARRSAPELDCKIDIGG